MKNRSDDVESMRFDMELYNKRVHIASGLKQDACPYPVQVLLDMFQSLDHAIAIYRRKSSKDHSGWLSSGMRIYHEHDSLGSHNITAPSTNRDFPCGGFLAQTYMKLPDLIHSLIATKNILLNLSSISL